MSCTSFRSILKFNIHANPFHLVIVHHFTRDDFQRRVQLCSKLLELITPNKLSYLILSDGSMFHLNKHVLVKTCIIWATTDNKPENHFAEKKLNPLSIVVWYAISPTMYTSQFSVGDTL